MTVIISGLDDFSGRLAVAFFDNLKTDMEAGAVCLFPCSPDNCAEDFRRQLLDQVENQTAAGRHEPPRICFFLSAFAEDGLASLDALSPLSEKIRTILSVQQSVTLVVLFPPITAGDEEKINTFRFFLKLETLIDVIHPVNIIFVNQLSQAVHGNCGAGTLRQDPLFDLICQQITAPDLQDTIVSIGKPTVENQYCCGNRRTCYATSGVVQLRYYRSDCLAYIKTRIERYLYQTGFMNQEALAGNTEAVTQVWQRADRLIAELIQSAREDVIPPGGVQVKQTASPADPDAMIAEARRNRDDILSIITEHKQKIDQREARLLTLLNQKLDACLAPELNYLAGGALFCDILVGRPAIPSPLIPAEEKEQARKLCGRLLFRHEVLDQPAKSCADDFGKKLKLLTGSGDSNSKLISFAKKLTASLPSQADINDFDNLINEPASFFISDLESLYGAYQTLEQDFLQYKQSVGWMGRSLTKRAALKEKREALVKTYTRLVEQQVPALRQLFALINTELIIPRISAVYMNKSFQLIVDQTATEWEGFISRIEAELNTRCVLSEEDLPSYRSATAETVPDKETLDNIFASLVKDRDPAKEASGVIEYLPSIPEKGLKGLSYYPCRDMPDLYHAGSRVFMDRLSDYSETVVQPVRLNNILDMIEINGSEKAYDFFKETLSRLDRFLAFSTGLIPRVEQANRTSRVLLARSDAAINSRLQSGYPHLFDPETKLIDSQTPDQIDCIRLIFGFPAFLIHGLKECRDLYLKDTSNTDRADLWPEAVD